MKERNQKEHVLLYKILFTFIIILIYIVGRNIPLYGIDIDQYQTIDINAQSMLTQLISGDMSNCSLFILGLWPYMLGSMFMILVMAIKSLDDTNKISPKKMNICSWIVTMMIAFIQAYERVQGFIYRTDEMNMMLTKGIVFVELITGMLIVIYMCDCMTKYGIGGRTIIFLINILDGILEMLGKVSPDKLVIPFIISVLEIAVMIFLERTEKRIAVQRVSIHNIYADKNYIAYKLNPVGVMPMMFASAVFVVPQFIVRILYAWKPENATFFWLVDNMKLTSRLGIGVYLGLICILNITFSFIILSPGQKAEELLKSGDSILNIYAGKPTRRYLVGTVMRFAIYSSIVISVCQGIPLCLQFEGYIDPVLAMLPGSIMMCTGIWISLYREVRVYRNMDRYKPFV